MSLQYAAALMNQRDKQEPLERGLSAGQAAYRNAGQSSLGQSVSQGLSQAAAQRQVLTDNAAKQAAGQYGNTGTSAAAYEYLHGQGKYPVNPVPGYIPLPGTSLYKGLPPAAGGTPTSPVTAGTTGAPIQKPYEQANNVGNPTQADLANTAKTSPTKMGARPTPPGIAKPSTMNQLLATLGPMYLGYTLLDKTGGLKALGEGWDKLFPSSSGLPAGYDASSVQALIDQSYTNPSVEVASASDDALQALTERQAAEKAATDAAIAEGATQDAAMADAASIGAANDATAAADYAAADYGVDAAAASEAGLDWAAMSTTYGPYAAAAIIADQLTGGKISGAVGDVIEGAGDVGQDIIDTGTDVVEDFGNAISDVFDFGWAKGGQIGGLGAAAQHYNLGGYSDGGRLLKGPGDGVSDSIPAVIGNKQPARLADGEFVVPARIVSELGNGSTEAGARKLYAMMERIQKGRKKSIGKGKVAVNSRADKHLPA